ncbi:Cytochrome P450 71A1 [Linum perenne]
MSELLKLWKKTKREVRKQVGEKGRVDHEDLGQLKYLIKETSRLHPPAPLLTPREAREGVVIHGYEIPAKTIRIIFNAWVIARDHRKLVEPYEFVPERFMIDDDDHHGLDYSLIPFGSGRRMCPGVEYGMTVVTLCLANLLYYFDWELPHDDVTPLNLDMSEDFGATVRRKNHLFLMPITHRPIVPL